MSDAQAGAGCVGGDGRMLTDPYLLRGLVCCGRCGQSMVPAYGGVRVYSCGPGCDQPDLPAEPAEMDLLLRALVRLAVTVHPDLVFSSVGAPGSRVVSARWRGVDPSDRRAVLLAVCRRVDVTPGGGLRPVWRHGSDGAEDASGLADSAAPEPGLASTESELVAPSSTRSGMAGVSSTVSPTDAPFSVMEVVAR